MTKIYVITSFLCATGVAVITAYSFLTHHSSSVADQNKAEALVKGIERRGTIADYKPRWKYSTVVGKRTSAKIVDKNVKVKLRLKRMFQLI